MPTQKQVITQSQYAHRLAHNRETGSRVVEQIPDVNIDLDKLRQTPFCQSQRRLLTSYCVKCTYKTECRGDD